MSDGEITGVTQKESNRGKKGKTEIALPQFGQQHKHDDPDLEGNKRARVDQTAIPSSLPALARIYNLCTASGVQNSLKLANGLANYSLVVDEREDRRRLVYDVEDSWYKGAHPLTFTQHQQLNNQHKQLLQAYRDDMQQTFDGLRVKTEKFDAEQLFDDRNLQLIETFNCQLVEASKACSDGLADVSKQLIVSSVKMLQTVGFHPPCAFAVLGLGSLAKGEATPYSDLEYAFLVERDDEYFTSLAVDSYFRLAGLGESPLKTFDLAELKSVPLATAHEMKAGLRIDGITKNSGNIPTGNGKENSQSLMLTVDGLMGLYKASAESPFDGMAGDKSDMLSATQVIYSNEGGVSRLHTDFLNARRFYEDHEEEHSADVCQKRLQSFACDLEQYTFLPEFAEFKPPNNANVKLKADIFRYPTLLANNIKMCLALDLRYAWEVFDWLRSESMLSMETHLYIRIVLCLSIFMRTSAYLHHKCQTDTVTANSLDNVYANKHYSIDFNLFVIMGRLLTPLKQQISSSICYVPLDSNSSDGLSDICETSFNLSPSAEHTSMKEVFHRKVTKSLNSISIAKDDFLTEAEVIYFAGNYSQAKKLLSGQIGGSLDFQAVDSFLQKLQLGERAVRKYKQLCGYLLYFTKDYFAANKYFRYLIKLQPSNANIWKLLSAHCNHETGNFKSARRLLDEGKAFTARSEDSLADLLKFIYGVDAVHQDISESYSNIGTLLCYLSEHKQSIRCHKRAIEVATTMLGTEANHPDIAVNYNGIAAAYMNLGEYERVLEYHAKSLQVMEAVYGAQVDHPIIVACYNGMGKAYVLLGAIDKSLRCLNKSLNMGIAIFGTESSNLDMAETYNNLGNTYGRLGKLEAALEYYKRSLEMREAVYGVGNNSREVANSCNNIGLAHKRMGNFSDALKYYFKSLEMKQAMYGTEAKHSEIMRNCANIGETYRELSKFEKALEFQLKALDIAKAVYGEQTVNVFVAGVSGNIGSIYRQLGNYSVAMAHFNRSSKMLRRIFSADANHEYEAEACTHTGLTYHDLGEYKLAMEYHTKALEMLTVLYGFQKDHPRKARCLNNIGRVYCKLGEYTLALESCNKSVKMATAVYGAQATHPDLAKFYDGVGCAYLGLGKHAVALSYHKKALDRRKVVHDAEKNYGDMADSYSHIGDVYRSMHDYQLALEHYVKALDMGNAVYGDEATHPCAARCLYNIGETYRGLGDHTLSRDHLTKSLEMYRKVFGSESIHPDVVECSARLQSVCDKFSAQS